MVNTWRRFVGSYCVRLQSGTVQDDCFTMKSKELQSIEFIIIGLVDYVEFHVVEPDNRTFILRVWSLNYVQRKGRRSDGVRLGPNQQKIRPILFSAEK